MTYNRRKIYSRSNRKERPAIALILTIVVLVVLTTVVYSLSSRISIRKHRNLYIIDYQKARYACDSAMKYALATVTDMTPTIIPRTDFTEVYDFSDLFHLDHDEYLLLIEQVAELTDQKNKVDGEKKKDLMVDFAMTFGDPNLIDFDALESMNYYDPSDPNKLTIPGPYGPPWPHMIEPMELEIAEATVTIEVLDENAKMPLTWIINSDRKLQRQTDAALETFCKWMQMDNEQIDDLKDRLKNVKEIKEFSLKPKPIYITEQIKPEQEKKPTRRRRSSRRSRRSKARTKKTTRPAIGHTSDFARLLHSSIIDIEDLAEPLEDTGERYESPLKYLALWGSNKVNINTAPRHVLEAAFTFGGDEVEIADEIIKRRRLKPFKNADDLREQLYRYSGSIEQVNPYIIYTSTFLAIRVTASSGSATTSSVATVIKQGKKVEMVAIIPN